MTLLFGILVLLGEIAACEYGFKTLHNRRTAKWEQDILTEAAKGVSL